MKKIGFIIVLLSGIFMMSCAVSQQAARGQPGKNGTDAQAMKGDTIRIANDKLEYEIIIIDPGFSSWFNAYAKPRNFYSQAYLEARNRTWVPTWNVRAASPLSYGDLYGMRIDYEPNIDYGYEVNYMLYYYLTYFQLTNRVQLGGLSPRI